MEQIAIGTSGLTTSRVGLGTWAIGGWMWGGSDEAQSIATIRAAVDRGVTLIDTAPVYGFGRSEEIVGKATSFEGDDLRKIDPKFQGERFRQYLRGVDALGQLARQRFGKSVLALALRWVLDQGPTIALWGARHPGQIDPIAEIDGWHVDAAAKGEIDTILKRCIPHPVAPEFMAPPLDLPGAHERSAA